MTNVSLQVFFFFPLFNWSMLSTLGIWQSFWKWNYMRPRTGFEIFPKELDSGIAFQGFLAYHDDWFPCSLSLTVFLNSVQFSVPCTPGDGRGLDRCQASYTSLEFRAVARVAARQWSLFPQGPEDLEEMAAEAFTGSFSWLCLHLLSLILENAWNPCLSFAIKPP